MACWREKINRGGIAAGKRFLTPTWPPYDIEPSAPFTPLRKAPLDIVPRKTTLTFSLIRLRVGVYLQLLEGLVVESSVDLGDGEPALAVRVPAAHQEDGHHAACAPQTPSRDRNLRVPS